EETIKSIYAVTATGAGTAAAATTCAAQRLRAAIALGERDKQRELARDIFAFAFGAARCSIRILDGTTQFKFALARFTVVFIEGHDDSPFLYSISNNSVKRSSKPFKIPSP